MERGGDQQVGQQEPHPLLLGAPSGQGWEGSQRQGSSGAGDPGFGVLWMWQRREGEKGQEAPLIPGLVSQGWGTRNGMQVREAV